MTYNNILFKNLTFIISGASFFLLIAPASFMGIFSSLFAALILYFITRSFPTLKYPKEKWIFIVSAIIAILSGYIFFVHWISSSKVTALATNLSIHASFLLIICSILGSIFSLPFILHTINMIFSSEKEIISHHLHSTLHSKKFFVACIFFAFFGIATQCYYSFSYDIWTDEAFSLKMIQHNYIDIVSLTAADVHPPLYYFILKFFVDIIQLIFPKVPTIFTAKAVSVVPYIILLVFLITRVRKEFGNFVAGMCSLCLLGMPNMISYGVEIRMYSWALLFVTLSFFCAHYILISSKKKFFSLFLLFSIAAAYTHYFACVAVAILYLVLLIRIIIKERQKLKCMLLISFATIALYLPWLFVVIKQAVRISSNYWIPDITPGTVLSYIYFLLDNNITLLIMFASFMLFLCNALKHRTDYPTLFLSFMGISVPIGTILVGIIASLIIRPVFVSRYMMPGLLCFWFGLILIINKQKNTFFKSFLTIFLIVLSSNSLISFILDESTATENGTTAMNFIESFDENTKFITDDDHVSSTICGLSETGSYIWGQPQYPIIKTVYDNAQELDSLSQIAFWLNSGYTVYFAQKEDFSIESLPEENSLQYMYVGSYSIGANVDVYEIAISISTNADNIQIDP